MKLVTLALLALPFTAHAQTITTVAGTGTAGYSGDGSAAISAQLNGPGNLAFDAAGNMYVAEVYNFLVRKISTSGVITTYAGTGTIGYSGDGGPATAAQLATVQCLAFDAAGNLYISDHGNLRVRKVSPAGIISTFAGTGATGSTGDGGPASAATFSSVNAVAVDGAGNIYISDPLAHKVRKVNSAGIISSFAGTGASGSGGDGGPATAATLNFPTGMAADAAGNVYITDANNRNIRKVNASGVISKIAGNGSSGYTGNGGPATAARLNAPQYPSLDGNGYLYFADCQNNVIRAIHLATGLIDVVAGNGVTAFAGDGGSPLACSLNNPGHFLTDGAGNAWIADYGNHRVRKITGFTIALDTDTPQIDARVSLFPNPSHSSLTISAPYTIADLCVTDLSGKVVLHNKYSTKLVRLDVNDLPTGVYCLSINGIRTKTFTKE